MTGRLTVVATDKVALEGLQPLTGDDRFDVVRVDDSGTDSFLEVLGHSAGLIVRSATRVDTAMMDRAPLLKVIGRAGVGVDNIDVTEATRRSIAVVNAPGGNTLAAAELTMALLLAAVRHVPAADRSVRSGEWARSSFVGIELHGLTLGLVGAGRIGAEVARRCLAFGMSALAFDPYRSPDPVVELGIRLTSLEEVIESADVISCHVPLNEETRGLVSGDLLQRMRKGAILINTSRGGVVDEAALARALHQGHLYGAALDVYEDEPLPADSPLRDAPNLVMTPHLGASTRDAQLRVAREVAGGIRAVLIEGDLSAAVNRTQITR